MTVQSLTYNHSNIFIITSSRSTLSSPDIFALICPPLHWLRRTNWKSPPTSCHSDISPSIQTLIADETSREICLFKSEEAWNCIDAVLKTKWKNKTKLSTSQWDEGLQDGDWGDIREIWWVTFFHTSATFIIRSFCIFSWWVINDFLKQTCMRCLSLSRPIFSP